MSSSSASSDGWTLGGRWRYAEGGESKPERYTEAVNDGPLFKILTRNAWEARGATLPRAPVDEADGFVHLSAASQVRETAEKHFADATELVLIRLEGPLPGLRWEPSRGGALFPHVYGDVPLNAVRAVTQLVGARAGAFEWPDDVA